MKEWKHGQDKKRGRKLKMKVSIGMDLNRNGFEVYSAGNTAVVYFNGSLVFGVKSSRVPLLDEYSLHITSLIEDVINNDPPEKVLVRKGYQYLLIRDRDDNDELGEDIIDCSMLLMTGEIRSWDDAKQPDLVPVDIPRLLVWKLHPETVFWYMSENDEGEFVYRVTVEDKAMFPRKIGEDIHRFSQDE